MSWIGSRYRVDKPGADSDDMWSINGDGWPFDPHGRIGPSAGGYQRGLNEDFPAAARWLKDQPNSIAVRARIEWALDGEEWVDGTAIRWDRTHVLVAVSDPRCQTIGFWLRPEDVRRR